MEILLAIAMEWLSSNNYEDIFDYAMPSVMYAATDSYGGDTVAVYLPETNTIIIDPSLAIKTNSVEFNSYVVHELVHFLQDQRGLLTETTVVACVEQYAYSIQLEFLTQNGIYSGQTYNSVISQYIINRLECRGMSGNVYE